MRLELRASGGHECEKCGSTELLHIPSTNEAIVSELTEIIEGKGGLENDLMAVFDARRAKLEATWKAEVEGFKKEMVLLFRDELSSFVDGLDTFLPDDVSRVRVLKRRWTSNVRTQIAIEAEKIRLQTHLL